MLRLVQGFVLDLPADRAHLRDAGVIVGRHPRVRRAARSDAALERIQAQTESARQLDLLGLVAGARRVLTLLGPRLHAVQERAHVGDLGLQVRAWQLGLGARVHDLHEHADRLEVSVEVVCHGELARLLEQPPGIGADREQLVDAHSTHARQQEHEAQREQTELAAQRKGNGAVQGAGFCHSVQRRARWGTSGASKRECVEKGNATSCRARAWPTTGAWPARC